MIRVLFVDDEKNVLNGLQRIFRQYRNEWDMNFLTSGEEALRAFDEKPFDVIVSDMRMPEMDGPTLLNTVRSRFPRTVRVVLSGQAEPESVLKVVGSSHQYLSKPCEPERLSYVIKRGIGLRDLLEDERVQRLIAEMDTLPTVPSVYKELVAALEEEDPNLRHVADLVASDVALTVMVLKLINSAFFGLRQTISSPRDAVRYLGLGPLSTLVLGAGLVRQFELDPAVLDIEAIWQQSLRTSAYTKAMAKAEGASKEEMDAAATAGLLHDLGKMVLASNMPDEYRSVAAIGTQEAEIEHFGTDHGRVGAVLLGLWGLPQGVVEAVAYHKSLPDAPVDDLIAPAMVHVADVLASGGEEVAGPIDHEYLTETGLEEKLERWQEACPIGDKEIA